MFFRCQIRFVSLLWTSPSCSTNVLCSLLVNSARNEIRLRFTYSGSLHFLGSVRSTCSFTNQAFVKSKKASIALSGYGHRYQCHMYLSIYGGTYSLLFQRLSRSWFPFYLSSKHVQSIKEPWPFFLDLICLAYVYFTAFGRGLHEGFCSK